MTSVSISARNRANAAKSTGPRSKAGKAVVSQNARRHGATARLDPELVTTWLKSILNTSEISHEDRVPDCERGRLSLNLARAEADVFRSERALADFERGTSERWTRDPLEKADTYNSIFLLLDIADRVLWDDPQSAKARAEDDPYWLGPWDFNPMRDLGIHDQIEFVVSQAWREISLHPPHPGRKKAEAVMREIEQMRTPKIMPLRDQHRLLKRYLGAAKSRRKKALETWLEHNIAEREKPA